MNIHVGIMHLRLFIITPLLFLALQTLKSQKEPITLPSLPEGPEWLICPGDDNESILKMLGKYIDEFYNISPRYTFNENDDLVLTYDLKHGESSLLRINTVTMPSTQKMEGNDTIVTGRRIKVSAFIDVSEIIADSAVRSSIIELNNLWLNEHWYPHSISLTTNGRIAMHSSINIPGQNFPLHVEYVRELISGTLTAWEKYSAALLRTIDEFKK